MNKNLETTSSADIMEKLWINLLENKNFFGFEFLRNGKISDVSFDFICPEVRFAIKIQSDKKSALSRQQKKSVTAEDYRFVILSARELTEDFKVATDYLTDQFSDLVRFKCDC